MMRTMRSEGFVLFDSREQRYGLTLLDRNYGKVRVRTPYKYQRPQLHGALLEYELTVTARDAQILDIGLLALPTYASYNHMIFMHQVLELIQFLIPEGAESDELYEMLTYLATSLDEVACQQELKKILLGKIFFVAGGYDAQGWHIDDLVQLPLSELQHMAIHDYPLDRLNAMVYHCLARQPYAHLLKTVRFIKEGDR